MQSEIVINSTNENGYNNLSHISPNKFVFNIFANDFTNRAKISTFICKRLIEAVSLFICFFCYF